MGLFDRHAGLLDAYRDVRTTGYDPFQIRMERVLSPTEAIINGRKTLLVGTNNYFGLTFDPSCIDAAIEAIRAEGDVSWLAFAVYGVPGARHGTS